MSEETKPKASLEEQFVAYRLKHGEEPFFAAMRDFTGYQKLYGKRKDGAFEDLELVPENSFPNTL
jgi:hypothetical protein